MRNRILIIVLVTAISSSGILSGQTTKGNILLGEFSSVMLTGTGNPTNMNLGWSTYKQKSDSGDEDNSDPDKEFSLNLTPRVGYFVINNLALGLDFTLGYTHSKSAGGNYVSSIIRTGTGPFIRYYIPTQKILPFLEANYSIGSSKQMWEYDSFDGEYLTKVQQYGFGIGLGCPIGEKVSFDTLIGYQSHIYKEKEDNEDNERSIIGTLGLKIGLTVFL